MMNFDKSIMKFRNISENVDALFATGAPLGAWPCPLKATRSPSESARSVTSRSTQSERLSPRHAFTTSSIASHTSVLTQKARCSSRRGWTTWSKFGTSKPFCSTNSKHIPSFQRCPIIGKVKFRGEKVALGAQLLPGKSRVTQHREKSFVRFPRFRKRT